eukprot:scaffold21095_cov29-Attheya_sp.AAC.1
MGSKRIRYKIKVVFYAVCFVSFYRNIFEAVFSNIKSASESNAKNEVAEHLCTTLESYQQVKEQLPCEWTDTGLWDQPTDEINNKSLLQVAEEHAHHLFAGKSVLVIGGSTSRDLAADFMHAVLPLKLRHNVSLAWNASSLQGYELFPGPRKNEKDFHRMYKKEVMFPLMNAGWNFTRLSEKSSGCSDCVSNYVNVDYFAELFGGHTRSASGITYEFSWKPDIFAPKADTDGFTHRFCAPNRRYDIVFIGRGLHDAVFKNDKLNEHSAVDTRFRRLAGLLECFPETTLIILRTPYVTTNEKEQERVLNITESMINLARNGTFGFNRTLIIDGHLLTTSTAHPESFDGHHYDSRVAQSVWRLIFFASAQFFAGVKLDGLVRANSFKESLGLHWHECGITAW